MPATPFSGLYSGKKRPKPPLTPGSAAYNEQYGAGAGMGAYKPPAIAPPNRVNIGGYDAIFDWPDFDGPQMFQPPADQIAGWETGQAGAPGGVTEREVWERPDYSGILGRYQGDWRARINAQAAANRAQQLSRSRGALNALGIRAEAIPGMLQKLGQYGITQKDLEMARDNPFSTLNQITKAAEKARANTQAAYAARGTFRSGGTAERMQELEDARALQEAQATQETESAISENAFQAADWERNAWDEFDQRSAELESSLAQAYQPYAMTAQWDPGAQAYRAPNGRLYNAQGQVVG